MPGYELLSVEDEPQLQPDDLADVGSALDDMQRQSGPSILQQPPAPTPFNFASSIRGSGGNTRPLLSVIREADPHLPPRPVIGYSERAGLGEIEYF